MKTNDDVEHFGQIDPAAYAAREREAKLQAMLESIPVWGIYRWYEVPQTVALKLKENAAEIVRLNAENAKLTEMWKSAEDANIQATQRLAEFRDENAKLREENERLRAWYGGKVSETLDDQASGITRLRGLVERLRSYTEHTHSCRFGGYGGDLVCTCGRDDALAECEALCDGTEPSADNAKLIQQNVEERLWKAAYRKLAIRFAPKGTVLGFSLLGEDVSASVDAEARHIFLKQLSAYTLGGK